MKNLEKVIELANKLAEKGEEDLATTLLIKSAAAMVENSDDVARALKLRDQILPKLKETTELLQSAFDKVENADYTGQIRAANILTGEAVKNLESLLRYVRATRRLLETAYK